ncbi:hypothetical protein S40285_09707, partial [Stachybotrys chlorohalonatus IBT 40285]
HAIWVRASLVGNFKSGQQKSQPLRSLEQQLEKVDDKLRPGGKQFKIKKYLCFYALKWPFGSEEAKKAIEDLARCREALSLALQLITRGLWFIPDNGIDERIDDLAIQAKEDVSTARQPHFIVPFPPRQGLPQAERRQLALVLRNFTNIMRIRKYFAAGNLDAINFMELARNFEVTEPRDKIFALLALFAESDKKGLDDYSLSAGDLFCRFAVSQAGNGRAVKLLDHAGLQRNGAANTPSWVPDWTFKAESSAEIVSRCRKWLSANLRKFDSSFCVASGRALLLRGS